MLWGDSHVFYYNIYLLLVETIEFLGYLGDL